MDAKTRMYERIKKHGNDLKAILNLPDDIDAVKLCKKLHSLELEANREMIKYCNGELTGEQIEEYTEKLIKRVLKVIGAENGDKLYINHDPRGYTLKLTENATKQAGKNGINIYRDWGGYGIIAPYFNGQE